MGDRDYRDDDYPQLEIIEIPNEPKEIDPPVDIDMEILRELLRPRKIKPSA